MIIYFKCKKKTNPKNKYKKYETLTTKLKSLDKFVIVAATSSSLTLSLTEIVLIAIPISSGIACRLTIRIKVIYEVVMQKLNKYEKQYERDQQTLKSFNKLHRFSFQDNIFDKSQYESLRNFFIK